MIYYCLKPRFDCCYSQHFPSAFAPKRKCHNDPGISLFINIQQITRKPPDFDYLCTNQPGLGPHNHNKKTTTKNTKWADHKTVSERKK